MTASTTMTEARRPRPSGEQHPPRHSPEEVAELVTGARDGDPAAWEQLVRSYTGLVRGVARSHRLGAADTSDVEQAVWLRLLEGIHGLHEPRAVGSWLVTTARRECLLLLRRRWSLIDVTDLDVGEPESRESAAPCGERAHAALQALDRLPARSSALLTIMMEQPELTYREISSELHLPVGSIGPTRARSLAKLRLVLTDPPPHMALA